MNFQEKLLFELVSIKSTSGKEAKAVDYLAGHIAEAGWEAAFVDNAGNMVASRGSGPKEIVLMGHIDTVPGGPEVRIERKVLWGRGSVDAKGPLCAFVCAGGKAEIPPGWRITLVGAVGEETDSKGAKYRISRHSPQACIIAEPSGTSGVTLGYRGSLRTRLFGHDSGYHRSNSQGPSTACVKAAAGIINSVEEMDDPTKKIIERPHAAIVTMKGIENGGRSAEIILDIRMPIGKDVKDFEDLVREAADVYGVRSQFDFAAPAHMVPKNDPVVRCLKNAVRKEGLKPTLYAKSGTADFNLAAVWRCPMAAYGPGDSVLDHTADERLDLEKYLMSISVIENALPKIMESLDNS